jgi:hypothetical protein
MKDGKFDPSLIWLVNVSIVHLESSLEGDTVMNVVARLLTSYSYGISKDVVMVEV